MEKVTIRMIEGTTRDLVRPNNRTTGQKASSNSCHQSQGDIRQGLNNLEQLTKIQRRAVNIQEFLDTVVLTNQGMDKAYHSSGDPTTVECIHHRLHRCMDRDSNHGDWPRRSQAAGFSQAGAPGHPASWDGSAVKAYWGTWPEAPGRPIWPGICQDGPEQSGHSQWTAQGYALVIRLRQMQV